MMLEKPQLKSKDAQDVDDVDITNDREKDIERRLALLVEEGSSSIETETDPMKTAKSVEETLLQGKDNLIVFERNDDEPENPRSGRLPEQVVPEKVISSGNLESDLPQALKHGTQMSTKKNALLARIMAAQQKAKLVQTTQPEDQPSINNSDGTIVHKNNDKLEVHARGHNNNALDKGTELVPPPPFDGIEELQKSKQEETFPPPFESVHADILQFTCAPSAPPVEDSCSVILDHADHLDGVTPIMLSPSCFDKDKQEKETDLFASFQLEGLSEEDKIKMMEEQRKIMEEIKQHTVENTTSVVAARANAFDLRSNVNAAAAASTSNGSAAQVTCGVSLDEHSTFQSSEERTVNIGSGQQVALYGEGRTRDAMKDGTAILVECPNCQSWMQVAATATLMYCPLCSTVSPVTEQGEIMSKEELTQIENDRKLAERLQNVESTQGEPSEESQQYQITNSEENNKSWWDSISETFLPSSVSSEQTEKNYAAVSVSQPPGYSLQEVNTGLGMTAEKTVDSSIHEQERLLGHSNRSTETFRVAERKPLFSCVVDGISNTANVLGTTLGSNADEDNNNVHGIDTTSLLAVPESTGREN